MSRKLPKHVDTLGDAIRFLREREGFTLRGLGRAVGLSAPFLSDIEHNRRPSTEKLTELALVLKVDVGELQRLTGRVDRKMQRWLAAHPEIMRALRARMRGERLVLGGRKP